MPSPNFVPPLDYLRAASKSSLQSYELARRNHAANLRREIATLIDRWIDETSEANLARWMIDHRESLQSLPATDAQTLALPEPALDPFPGASPSSGEIVPAAPRYSDPHSASGRRIGHRPHPQKSTATG